jgi:hypothetical protein
VTGLLGYANFADGSALSVTGRASNSSGVQASIAAGTDHQVLRRSGTALAFGAINLAQAAAVTGILAGANGVSGNGFFAVTGPTTSLKTFTLPNASATILTSNAAVTVAQGGTGIATTTAYGVICGGTTATGNFQNAGAGTAGQVLVSNGASALPSWGSLASGWDLLAVATASASSSLDFTTGINSTYDQYSFMFDNLLPGTDAVTMLLQISTDGGSTWINTGGTYIYTRQSKTTGSSTFGDESSNASDNLTIRPSSARTLDSASTSGINGEILCTFASGKRPGFNFDLKVNNDNDSTLCHILGAAVQSGTTKPNAMRFIPSSGNWASGVIRMYGLRKTV